MSAEVEGQKYKGVDVTNPRIREYAKNMIKEGRPREEICRVIGMPHEVIEEIERDMKK